MADAQSDLNGTFAKAELVLDEHAALTSVDVQKLLPKLNNLSPIKQQYLTLLNSGQHNDVECAEILGVSAQVLGRWRRGDREFRHYYEEARRPVLKRLAGLKPRAVARLGKLIESTDERVALAACLPLLKVELSLSADVKAFDDAVEETVRDLEQFLSEDQRRELAAQLRAAAGAQQGAQPAAGNGVAVAG